MSSIRSSRLAVFLLVAALALTAVAPAAAVTVEERDAPDEAKVGSEVTATFAVADLYTDYEKWTLNGRTELRNVTWTVTLYDQADNRIEQDSYDGQSFNRSIDIQNDVDEVSVTVRGTVPTVENFSYDPAQTFRLAAFNQVREGGTSEPLKSVDTHHYTTESDEARQAISSAAQAVSDAEDADADVTEANSDLDDAISAFDGGSNKFTLAADLATKAEEKANQAKQAHESTTQRNRLLMYGGVGVVGLAAVGGGVYWYRSQQDSYDKLR